MFTQFRRALGRHTGTGSGGGPGWQGGSRKQIIMWAVAFAAVAVGALFLPHHQPQPRSLAANCGLVRCSASISATRATPTLSPVATAGAQARRAAPQFHAVVAVSASPRPSARPSPRPVPVPNGTLAAGSEMSLNATTPCCTSDYLLQQGPGAQAVLRPVASGGDKSSATWIVRRGLASGACVSFEAKAYPGDYLRQQNSFLYLEPGDGSSQFAADATFCPVAGIDGQGYSFRSYSDPARYIRHFQYNLYIASDGGPNPSDNPAYWTQDVSWLVTQPWAP